MSVVSATLVTGLRGAGKTTAILHLVAQKPIGERWAVLVTEQGEASVESIAHEDVVVREIAGGCICCTANVNLRVALTRLLREVRPHRVLIELGGVDHVGAVVSTLRNPWLRGAMEVTAVVCVVDPSQFVALGPRAQDVYRVQLAHADVVVLNNRDDTTQQDLDTLRASIAAPRKIVETTRGNVPFALISATAA